MNVETPNWRSDLYNKYYGSVEVNTDYTAEEKAYKIVERNDESRVHYNKY